MRNKNKPGEYKYKYSILGKVDSMYEYFALHDFICIKENEIDVKDLKSKILLISEFILKPEDLNNYEGDLENAKKVKAIIDDKINENFLKYVSKDFTLLQPEKYSYGRNSVAHEFKELKTELDITKLI